MKDEILALVTAIAGAESGDSAQLSPLCQSAVDEITAKLNDGVEAADCHDAFLCAGAYLVMSYLAAADAAADFTAGEVTVRGSAENNRKRAQTLSAAAWRIMRPYTGADGFAFTEVEG